MDLGKKYGFRAILSSTDEPVTPVPSVAAPQQRNTAPHRGLDNNPGKDGALINDSHPYFPSDCRHCAFYKPDRKDIMASFFENRTKDCYHCPYIDGCVSRIIEKRRIDNNTAAKKYEVKKLGLMAAMEDFEVASLVTGILHRTGKSQQRFLKHLHHDYEVDAGVFVWNNPEKMEFVRISPLGEGKDLTKQEDIENIQRKKDRGVVEYLVYKCRFGMRNYLIKTEKLIHGNEQFYSLVEK